MTARTANQFMPSAGGAIPLAHDFASAGPPHPAPLWDQWSKNPPPSLPCIAQPLPPILLAGGFGPGHVVPLADSQPEGITTGPKSPDSFSARLLRNHATLCYAGATLLLFLFVWNVGICSRPIGLVASLRESGMAFS